MVFTEITDDLTGAVDSGSYFTARGQRLRICLSPDSPLDRRSGELLSVNLSSRNMDPRRALEVHERFLRRLPQSGEPEVFMKKIGTGCRGNDPFELEGLLRGRPEFLVFIVDHAPDLGTFTLYGHQYCEGQILHKSLYAADPVMPPTKSYIPDILSEGTDLPVGLADIDAVKGNGLLASVQALVDEGKRIIVFDAVTKADTMHILGTLMPRFPNVFWTGSLGIADGLAEKLFGERKPLPPRGFRSLRNLCFTASGYGIVKKQIAFSQSRGMKTVAVNADAWIDGQTDESARAADEAAEALKSANVMVYPHIEKHSHRPGANLKILSCIADTAERICRTAAFDRLTVIGGETAQSVMGRLGINQLELGQPLGTGIAEGMILDGLPAGKEFAMKGGSMGTERSLEAMMCRLEG